MIAVSIGIRGNYGILFAALSKNSSITYGEISLVLAVAQLIYGIMQPVFGIFALKKSNRSVLIIGTILIALGVVALPYSTNFWTLLCSLGIILSSGTGALSFGIIMGAVTPLLGEQKAAAVSGMINAASGVGSSILSLLLPLMITAWKFTGATLVVSLFIAGLLPLCFFLSREKHIVHATTQEETVLQVFKHALRHRTFLLLLVGFFTCGFHMAIIETHLYSQLLSYGIKESYGASAFSALGIATMLGALISGVISTRIKLKNNLTLLYAIRAIAALVFLSLPKTPVISFLFLILLGLTGAATVTPTAGLVSRTFGADKLGILFGSVFLSHQIGSFISAWLGGVIVTQTGSYTAIWEINIFLCLLASCASFAIQEK